jgi:hypothetical protein
LRTANGAQTVSIVFGPMVIGALNLALPLFGAFVRR